MYYRDIYFDLLFCRLLKDYVSKLPDDKKYSTTIIIGGTFKENDEFCVVLAYDDHVETMRRRFKHIDFEHLYSIQPISRFDDVNNALYLADNSLNYVSLPSSINKIEKKNISVSKQCVETKKDIDLPSTKVIEETSSKALNNHSNETKVEDKTKLDKTQKKVMLLHNLIFFLSNPLVFIYIRLEWISLRKTIKTIIQNLKLLRKKCRQKKGHRKKFYRTSHHQKK